MVVGGGVDGVRHVHDTEVRVTSKQVLQPNICESNRYFEQRRQAESPSPVTRV